MRNLLFISILAATSCDSNILGSMSEDEKFVVKVLGPDTVLTYVVDGTVKKKENGGHFFVCDGKYVEIEGPIIIEQK